MEKLFDPIRILELDNLRCVVDAFKAEYIKKYNGPIPPVDQKDYNLYKTEKARMVEILKKEGWILPFILESIVGYLNKLTDMIGDEKLKRDLVEELLKYGTLSFFHKLKAMNYQDRYDYILEWSSSDIAQMEDAINKKEDNPEVIKNRIRAIYLINKIAPPGGELTNKFVNETYSKYQSNPHELFRRIEKKYNFPLLGIRWEEKLEGGKKVEPEVKYKAVGESKIKPEEQSGEESEEESEEENIYTEIEIPKEVLSIPVNTLKNRIYAIYKINNIEPPNEPLSLAFVDMLYERYQGNIPELFRRIEERYNLSGGVEWEELLETLPYREDYKGKIPIVSDIVSVRNIKRRIYAMYIVNNLKPQEEVTDEFVEALYENYGIDTIRKIEKKYKLEPGVEWEKILDSMRKDVEIPPFNKLSKMKKEKILDLAEQLGFTFEPDENPRKDDMLIAILNERNRRLEKGEIEISPEEAAFREKYNMKWRLRKAPGIRRYMEKKEVKAKNTLYKQPEY